MYVLLFNPFSHFVLHRYDIMLTSWDMEAENRPSAQPENYRTSTRVIKGNSYCYDL